MRARDAAAKPQRPILSRFVVKDITIEALISRLQENPRGLLYYRDEGTAWILSMNQYRDRGRGADKEFWLSAWAGDEVKVDRKKDTSRSSPPLYKAVNRPVRVLFGRRRQLSPRIFTT